MKILLGIAGFLVALIAVAGIILLIIAIVKGKIKTPGAPSGKILKTIAVIGILSVLGWFGYRYFTGLPSHQQAPAVAQQEQLPVCMGGPDSYEFAVGEKQIHLALQPDCWSGWISLPLTKSFRIKTPEGKNVRLLTWRGEEFSSGNNNSKEEKKWIGKISNSNFRLRGEGEAVVTYE
jgi:hypothetical protein